MMKISPWVVVLVCVFGVVAGSDVQAIKIDFVYPNVGKLGEDLTVTIKGEGFTQDTRVSMALDSGNRRAIIGSVDTPGNAKSVQVVGDYAYVAGWGSGLVIMDISDPSNPAIIAAVNTPGAAEDVFVSGTTAYVADGDSGLLVVDVSYPTYPVIMGSVDTPGYAEAAFVSGTTAYVADDDSGLQVVDVSDPANPAIIGSVDTPGFAYDVFVSGTTAYVANGSSGLQVVDVSDPANPTIMGSVVTPGWAVAVFVSGTTAYVADAFFGLQVVDVSDPAHPTIIGSVDTSDLAVTVFVSGTTAYVLDSLNLQVVDVSVPSNPTIMGSVDTPDSSKAVFVSGTTAYVAGHDNDGYSVLQVVDVSDPANPIMGSVDTPGFAHDVFISDTTAYVAGYEWDGDYSGLEIMDVTDPANPTIMGSVNTPGWAKAVFVSGTTAYVADGSSGLQVVDVSDPGNPIIMGSVDTPGDAEAVFVSGTIAYVANYDSGLQVVDVSDPANPIIMGFVDTPGDANDVFVSGTTAYVADDDSGLQVVDVSDSTNPTIMGSVDTPGDARGVFVSGTTAYVADGYSGLQVVDVSDPTNPIIMGSVDTPGFAYDVFVSGTTAYVVGDDLQVADVSVPENPVIIGSVYTICLSFSIQFNDNLAYVAANEAGMVIVPVPVQADITYIDSTTLEVTLPSPELAGNYNLRAYNGNDDWDEMHGAVTFFETDDYQENQEKKAIILLGGGSNDYNPIWDETKMAAVQAYNTLMLQGYSEENIYFISPEQNIDPDRDNVFDDVDAILTKDSIFTALSSEWATSAGELLLYMVDHGAPGKFYLEYKETDRIWITAEELDAALDTLQTRVSGKIMVVYDACHSGSFIQSLLPPPGYAQNRYLITSTEPHRPAWFNDDGVTSFSFLFWTKLQFDPRIYYAFTHARNVMKTTTEGDYRQVALHDANGDGIPGEKDDNNTASYFELGRARFAAASTPQIHGVTEDFFLTGQTQASFSVKITDWGGDPGRVWALVSPEYVKQLPAHIPVSGLPVVEMGDPDGDDTYTGTYSGFTLEGDYQVSMFARNDAGLISIPETLVITQTDGEKRLPGDIDGDEKVNLKDAMIALLAASGRTNGLAIRENYPESGVDPDRDGVITVKDAVFILGELAGN